MTPEIQLSTMFLLDERGRISVSRETGPRGRPLLMLIRSATSCAWALRADVAEEPAAEVGRLAASEPPDRDLQTRPLHAEKYHSLLGGQIVSGPAFTFPDRIAKPDGITTVDELRLLERHFRGWTADEIPWRSPIQAIMHEGFPVSLCFCATRNSANVWRRASKPRRIFAGADLRRA